ncbi:hypothetical protein N7465_006732 [Penicillium sp. CMV-2018d]|nr:hypothetical protein N7465_006732 [Penicillium sp. CMV-2018d]
MQRYWLPTLFSATQQRTIYAQFDGDDKTDYKVTPGCKVEASWPRAYGDVYFGANNCLYDTTGTNING